MKKGKNEHNKTMSNTAVTGSTNSQNRVVAALLTVPNQAIKHPVFFNSGELEKNSMKKSKRLQRRKLQAFHYHMCGRVLM